jgi:hypothetical protein
VKEDMKREEFEVNEPDSMSSSDDDGQPSLNYIGGEIKDHRS